MKRGFRTKKEALNYESEFKRKASADMDMALNIINNAILAAITNNNVIIINAIFLMAITPLP